MALLPQRNRNQMQMFALEELISPDNEVRVIDALVDILNLEDLGFRMTGKATTGRDAYGSKALLKLYIYGYLNRIRSSRRLETECERNVELWWLLGQLTPRYKTIADFRKDNKKALLHVFKEFNRFLNRQGFFGKEVIAVDGALIRAQNSKKNNFNVAKIAMQKKYILQKSETYLQELEEADSEEECELICSKIEEQAQRLEKYNALEEKLAASGESQLSIIDPDARALSKQNGTAEVGYNFQNSVDGKHKLIATFQMINETDINALSSVAIETKEILEIPIEEQINALADKGYYTGRQIQQCTEAGIQTYVASKNRSSSKPEGFRKEDFEYLESSDEYVCYQGHHLTTNGKWFNKKNSKGITEYKVKNYTLPYTTCKECPHKIECVSKSRLKNKNGRQIQRSEYDHAFEANNQRLKANPTFYKRRQEIVEHPFGTIKRQWGYNYTLLRTNEKVTAEYAIICTCYNLRRIISIIGVKELIKRFKHGISSFFNDFKYYIFHGAVHQSLENLILSRLIVYHNQSKNFILC